jgi:hypothetical protein
VSFENLKWEKGQEFEKILDECCRGLQSRIQEINISEVEECSAML